MVDGKTLIIAGGIVAVIAVAYLVGAAQNRNDFYPDVLSVVPAGVPGVHHVVLGGIPHRRVNPYLWVGKTATLRHGAHNVGILVDGVRRVGGRAVVMGRLNMPQAHVRGLVAPAGNLRLRMHPGH